MDWAATLVPNPIYHSFSFEAVGAAEEEKTEQWNVISNQQTPLSLPLVLFTSYGGNHQTPEGVTNMLAAKSLVASSKNQELASDVGIQFCCWG